MIEVHTRPAPPEGEAPLSVNFNLCPSIDVNQEPLIYYVDFGDGETYQGACRVRHLYAAGRYTASACVWDQQLSSPLQCATVRVVAR
jgi:hypothetical protein